MPLSDTLAPDEYAAAVAAFATGNEVQVRGWQARLLVEPDGVPGPQTREALEANRPDGVEAPATRYHGHTTTSATRYSLSKNGSDYRLGDNFTLVEFASRCGADEVLNHPALVALLEEVRAHFSAELGRDVPVTISSGYRSPAHNKKIGGASRSRHPMGLAADVVVDRGRVSPDDVADFVETLAPGGLGRYKNFTHVDVQGENRRWDLR